MSTSDLQPLELDPDTEPWERQPGESVVRFNQFAAYREMGRARTIRKTAITLTLSPEYLRHVAAANKWVDRAEAWDLNRDQLHQAAWLDARREAATNDAHLLDAVIGKVASRLENLHPDELTAGELTRLLDVAVRHRRTLFGDPQMTVAVTGPGGDPLTLHLAEFADMTGEQRRQAILSLTEAVRRRAGASESVDDDDADDSQPK